MNNNNNNIEDTFTAQLGQDLITLNPFAAFINYSSTPVPYDCYFDKLEKQTVLVADLPGVSKDSISVNIDNKQKIIINGKRDCEKHPYKFSFRWCGTFQHVINLNSKVSPSNVHVKLDDGIMKVTITETNSNVVESLNTSNNNKVESFNFN